MKEINLRVKVPSSGIFTYPVIFGKNHWKKHLRAFLEKKTFSKVGFLVDEKVFAAWNKEIESFGASDILLIPSGESSKNINKAIEITGALTSKGYDRKSLLVAMGGGVVGDLCGFIASIYMRGIPYVQIPTTVLSIVDSSLGGKTGVDTPYGKNLVGSFHFPSLVIADTLFLQSLPEEQTKNGFVEMVKHALITDGGYYERLMRPFSEEEWPSLLLRSCEIKAKVVQKDPKEQNLRQILNFGHTLGHALEHAAGYSLLHGFAVAWGIIGEAFLSMKKKLLSEDDLQRLIRDFQHKGLLTSPEIISGLSWEDVRRPLLHDKKNQRDTVYVVLIEKIGRVKPFHGRYSHPFDEVSLKEAFDFLQNIAEDIYERH